MLVIFMPMNSTTKVHNLKLYGMTLTIYPCKVDNCTQDHYMVIWAVLVDLLCFVSPIPLANAFTKTQSTTKASIPDIEQKFSSIENQTK